MTAVRSLLFALYQMILTPPYALMVLALFWLPPLGRYRVIKGWCWLMLAAARFICGIRHRVTGLENMPATPCIVMSKHSSTWETLFLTQIFPPFSPLSYGGLPGAAISFGSRTCRWVGFAACTVTGSEVVLIIGAPA